MTSMVGFLAETAVETVVANEVLGVVEDSEAPGVGAVATLTMKIMDLGAVEVTEDLTIVGLGLGVLEVPATIGLLEVEKLTVDGLRVQRGLHLGTEILEVHVSTVGNPGTGHQNAPTRWVFKPNKSHQEEYSNF